MMEQTKFKPRKAIFAVLILVVASFGIAGLSSYRTAARAETLESNLFFPLVFKNALILPEESIMLLSPASGSQVTSPIHVSGVADPTFEQNLVVRVLQADGTLVV
jgi:hypothetical protein